MNQQGSKKIKAKKVKYQPKKDETVYQVDDPAAYVAPGETVEILIPGKEGFTVYLPIAGLFNAQVFEAEESPAWAQAAMAEADGAGEDAAKDPLWGVRMTRIVQAGKSPIPKMPYCIYSKELNNFAVGNSPPEMVLDP